MTRLNNIVTSQEQLRSIVNEPSKPVLRKSLLEAAAAAGLADLDGLPHLALTRVDVGQLEFGEGEMQQIVIDDDHERLYRALQQNRETTP